MLDEPFGALDRRFRERFVGEIDQLLDDRGATALYVTHDHDEAAAVSDRIAVMRAGVIVQVGTYEEIRRTPSDPWISDFLA